MVHQDVADEIVQLDERRQAVDELVSPEQRSLSFDLGTRLAKTFRSRSARLAELLAVVVRRRPSVP
jgi:hypothetical protein